MDLNEAGNKYILKCLNVVHMMICQLCHTVLYSLQLYVCYRVTVTATLLFLGSTFYLQTYLVYNEYGEQSQNVLCCHHVYNF